MPMNVREISQMIDISVLQTADTTSDVDRLIAAARQYEFVCVFALSTYLPQLVDAFRNEETLVGAPIGFPTGADMSQFKAFEARTLNALGCDEFDMVMNIGLLKSKRYREVEDDIAAVLREIPGRTSKVIVEAPYLTRSELEDACRIVLDSGAHFVKSASGWTPTPTELEHVRIMANTVRGRIRIKAAGGIRDLDTVRRMHDLGVTRFGVSVKSAINIVEEMQRQLQ